MTRHPTPPFVVVLVSALACGASFAATVDPTGLSFLPASPGVVGGAVGGFVNPAAWATGPGEVALTWDDRSIDGDAVDNWGLSLATPLGLAVRKQTLDEASSLWDTRLGFGVGDRRAHFGLAWRWASGAADAARAEDGLVLGTIVRPSRWLSIGSSTFLSSQSGAREAAIDLGFRPMGTPHVTLFGDAALGDGDRPDDATWSAGAQVRPIRGIEIAGRVREATSGDEEFLLSFGLSFGGIGAHVMPAFDDESDLQSTAYLLRVNPPARGLPFRSMGRERIRAIDLTDRRIGYRKDLWFDDERVAWLDLVLALRDVRDDPRLRGVALNLAGTKLRPSVAWELRAELEAIRGAGKRVVVHLDHATMMSMYVASAADRVSLDPLGSVVLPGIAVARTYLRGMLEKVGIGFEEHRLFRYKSAAETLTRSDMSDADREQLGRLVDALYEEIRDGIAAGRGLEPAQVDSLVEAEALLLPGRAQDAGLVDAVERWEDVREWAGTEGLTFVERAPRRVFPDERWGRPPKVALVYAEGECDVVKGIRARATSEHLRSLATRKDVVAVVLRADSPGGDPLAADLVADELARLRDGGKPVVVSQGDVAASGGYWISLDADHVLTTPMTITGSIGVISGWAWDAGFGGKVGISADRVQRGRHADLFAGLRVPLVGVRLPTRNLDAEERRLVDRTLMSLYDRFVEKVAAMRELPVESVREFAQGRVWSGADAVDRGLCDDLGGLADALDDAKLRAGVRIEDEILIEEYPPRRLFPIPALSPPLPRVLSLLRGGTASSSPDGESDYDLTYLRALAEAPGEPRLLLPPDHVPLGWWER